MGNRDENIRMAHAAKHAEDEIEILYCCTAREIHFFLSFVDDVLVCSPDDTGSLPTSHAHQTASRSFRSNV